MKHPIVTIACLLAASIQAQAQPAAPAPNAAPPPPEQVLAIPEPGRFKRLFQPFRTNAAALSPDGKYVAYSVREGEALSVVIADLDQPEKKVVRVQVIDDNAATPMLAANQREKTPGRINWMRWVTPTRLLVETNHAFATATGADSAWQSWKGAVIAFDADGTDAKLLVSPRDLLEFINESGSDNPFSVARGNSAGFNSRVRRPDQPIPAAGTEATVLPERPPDTTLLEADEDGTTARPSTGTAQPRTLRVFDLDPAHPEAVTLVATGSPRGMGNSRSHTFYSLNALTGRLTDLVDSLVPNTRAILLDRQGYPRLMLPNSLLSSFPFHYEHLGPRSKGRPRPLDEVAGLPGFSVSPGNYFGERSIPLGFAEDPNLLYYASNVGRDTYGIYSLDLAAKKRGSLSMENPAYDLIGPPAAGFPDQGALVFDRFTHQLIGVRYEGALRTTAWFRPEWQALQAQFEKTLPGRSVEITDWDEAGRRFLVTTEGPADPGAFYLYDAAKNQLQEFVRRAPWVDANHTHLTLPFSYSTGNGSRVSGLVTVPQRPRLKPIPMVVLCPDWPWQRVSADFHAEVQALADMGFVVVQLNGRGAWGLGLRQRQSLTAGYDLVQVEDIATTVASLEKIFNVNPRRVALLGRGHGGFIALRALQAFPDQFRCAIALDAPVNLADWLAEQKWDERDDVQPQLTRAWLGDQARLNAAPLDRSPGSITKPILLFGYPGPEGQPRRPVYLAGRSLVSRVRRSEVTAEFADLTLDYMNGLPAARASVFDRIEEFLNVNVYDYQVKLHELEIIKPPGTP